MISNRLIFVCSVYCAVLVTVQSSYLLGYDSSVEDCQSTCQHLLTNKEYEQCLVACRQPHLSRSYTQPLPHENSIDREYPSPPRDARVDLSVVIEDNLKYIKATVKWKNEMSSVPRRAIYLSFVAMGLECERKFPGYYSTNIPPNAEYWEIPLESKVDPLTILHDCTYRVELHSVPYIYRDPRYTALFNFTVPECVKGFCDCRAQRTVPMAQNVRVKSLLASDGQRTQTRVSWDYDWSLRDHQRIDFHVYLAKLHKTDIKLPIAKLFVALPVDIVLEAHHEQKHYSVIIPQTLEKNHEYQIQLFALNDHICSSKMVKKEFVIDLDELVTTTTAVSPTSVTWSPTPLTNLALSAYLIPVPHENTVTPKIEHAWIYNKNDDNQEDDNYTTVSEIDNNSTGTEPVSPPPTTHHHFLIFFPIIVILVLIIGIIGACKLYSTHKNKMHNKQKYLESLKVGPWANIMTASMTQNLAMETNILYLEKEIVDAQMRGIADRYEISYDRIRLGRVIGQGAFGLVYMGTADSINGVTGTKTVAVKQLKANADEQERVEFVSEITMMKQIGSHANIVQMYGCCTLALPHCMIMEYVPYGDLQAYLRNLRKEFDKVVEEYKSSLERDYVMSLGPQPLSDLMQSSIYSATSEVSARDVMTCSVHSDTIMFMDDCDVQMDTTQVTCSLDPAELQSFAIQVANGMAHLETLNITHRDLAARNILVGHGKILKISDFGLSRTGIYVKTTGGRIPLRWLSIEAMRDHIYTTKSDVWAYGIVLWEICTLGGFPYPTVSDKDLLRYLESGNRLEKPGSCSHDVYRLMEQCWSYCENHRPSFGSIRHKLDELDKRECPYVEFSAVSVSSLPSPSNMSPD